MGLRLKTESISLRFEYLIIIMIVFNANSTKKIDHGRKKKSDCLQGINVQFNR